MAEDGTAPSPKPSPQCLSLADLDDGVTTWTACENDKEDKLAVFLERRFGLGKELNSRSLAAVEGFSRAYSLR